MTKRSDRETSSHPPHWRAHLAPILILLALWGLQAGVNLWFVGQHRAGNPGDEVNHLETSLFYYHHGLTGLNRVVYPPLFYLVSILFHHCFGTSIQVSIAANWPFLLALMLGVYGLTFRITGSRAAGVVASWLASTYPLLASLSRMAMLDFALTGVTILALWLLVETAGFARPRISLAFGAVCGAGMLTRPSFAIFLAGPVLITLIQAWREATGPDRSRRLIHFGAASAIGLLIASYWYVPDFAAKMRFGAACVTDNANHADLSFFSWRGLVFYPYALTDLGISPWLTLFLLVAIPALIKNRWPHRRLFGVGLLVPYLIFSNLNWKLARYLAPLTPLLAILTVTGLLAWRYKKARYAGLILLTLTTSLQWAGLTFGLIPMNRLVENGLVAPIFLRVRFPPTAYREDIHVGPPNRQDSHVEEIGGLIRAEAAQNGPIDVVRMLNTPAQGLQPGAPYEHPLSFPIRYYLARERPNARLVDCYYQNLAIRCLEYPDFEPSRDIPRARLLLGAGADFIASAAPPGQWRLWRRFTQQGQVRELYRNEGAAP